MRETPLIRVRGISKAFSHSGVILKDLDFDLARGELVSIAGRSGAGKSTLMNILGLLDRPDHGTYELHGRPLTALPDRHLNRLRRENLGFIFQHYHLIEHLTALENVCVSRRLGGVPRGVATADATLALERVGMTSRAQAFPRTLSGGERQRVAIARALVNSPRILLCDEPTGNLDTETALQVLDLLHDAVDEQSSVVIVTHDDRVSRRATRRIELSMGRCRNL